MEIATTSSAFNLFPKEERFIKSKGVRFNLLDFSSLPIINPKVKRQKKTVEVDSSTKVRRSQKSLNRSIAITPHVAKPENSITAKPDGRVDLKNLIAKAQHKIHEKRHIDHRREHIARQRIAARLALNQMVATVYFNDYLNYYKELEQLGYTFMRDILDCLNMFSLWSRSDYNGETNSVLENFKTP
ncbi:PREDICTED: uncharacterized protein LOC104743605 [Camelina sativa]|uniref:Uncharacterized protein LOC104743605 n=1 Tax=Camelina sativa TaxID=90675 RepID=A0ABM0VYA0_CAMSA|nr:PREDICTED: uncharacterized protein LOC104743605 [Camelina sativa]